MENRDQLRACYIGYLFWKDNVWRWWPLWIWRVPHVGQEILTSPEHRSSWIHLFIVCINFRICQVLRPCLQINDWFFVSDLFYSVMLNVYMKIFYWPYIVLSIRFIRQKRINCHTIHVGYDQYVYLWNTLWMWTRTISPWLISAIIRILTTHAEVQ